jgi:hypothetical protein
MDDEEPAALEYNRFVAEIMEAIRHIRKAT